MRTKMEEIKIIKKQLKILEKKGIELDIVNDTIVFIDVKKRSDLIKAYNESCNKWNGMSKDVENYDTLNSNDYIVISL
jgi:hypothetical protein